MQQHRTHLRMLLALAVMAIISLHARPAPANTPDFGLGPDWREAVNTLKAMPVQDTGFIRSGYTFAENVISAITGKKRVGNTDAMESVLFLLRDPHRAQHENLIKISHPELVRIYGTTQISANQWRDMGHREALLAFLAQDEEKNMRPLNSIEYRARLIEGLEGEIAIIPRQGEWIAPVNARGMTDLSPIEESILAHWGELRRALAQNNPEAGRLAAAELVDAVTAAAEIQNVELPRIGLDLFYHSHQPYRNAAFFYLLSAIVFAGGFILAKQPLNWAGMALLSVGFLEHMIGITTRWILAGRAPLSNMFESFIFAVAGMILIALILEGFRFTKLVGLGAAILGFIFMVLAHKVPLFDSQIRPLMPALQSSWLTYHVVTIMLSYSAFALSFFISVVYLLKEKVFGGDRGAGFMAQRIPSLRSLDIFNYRIIAIGFPLLTIGIIAGGVWAATAWGRPWGFDPKETWSLITWLVYAIYLHVRFMAGWSGRSAAIIAIVGFLCVLFTYFGVNYLLPGLHSYV